MQFRLRHPLNRTVMSGYIVTYINSRPEMLELLVMPPIPVARTIPTAVPTRPAATKPTAEKRKRTVPQQALKTVSQVDEQAERFTAAAESVNGTGAATSGRTMRANTRAQTESRISQPMPITQRQSRSKLPAIATTKDDVGSTRTKNLKGVANLIDGHTASPAAISLAAKDIDCLASSSHSPNLVPSIDGGVETNAQDASSPTITPAAVTAAQRMGKKARTESTTDSDDGQPDIYEIDRIVGYYHNPDVSNSVLLQALVLTDNGPFRKIDMSMKSSGKGTATSTTVGPHSVISRE